MSTLEENQSATLVDIKLTASALLLCAVAFATPAQNKLNGIKRDAVKYIDARSIDLTQMSDQIWRFAEPSLKEFKSAAVLKEFLKREGFNIKDSLSGFPTMFMAKYGNSKPVIGLFGEYDADAGASNKVVPWHEEANPGGHGHGGHHNLLGVGSLGAALAIKDLIKRDKLRCSIIYYGTTAEGKEGGKTFLARDGFFDDLDASLYWHPSPGTIASTVKWDALIDGVIRIAGSPANPYANPGATSTVTAFKSLIAEMDNPAKLPTSGVAINYQVQQWNGSLDRTADTIRIALRIESARQEDALKTLTSLQSLLDVISTTNKVATEFRITRAFHQFLPNVNAMKLVQANIEALGPIVYDAQEKSFVRELQEFMKRPYEEIQNSIRPFSDQSANEKMHGFASDIGDASWIAPEIYFTVKTLPGVPMHSWPGTIFSAHSIGHKGMIHASKILALTIIDLVKDRKALEEIKNEFEKSTNGYSYKSLTPGKTPPN